MAEALSQESDISYASAASESSDSDEETFMDAVVPGSWTEEPRNADFNDFDATNSGPRHDLDRTSTVLDYLT